MAQNLPGCLLRPTLPRLKKTLGSEKVWNSLNSGLESGKNVLNLISLYLERDLELSNERVINTADNFLLHDGVLNLLQFHNFRLLEDFKCIEGASIRIGRHQHDTTKTSCT